MLLLLHKQLQQQHEKLTFFIAPLWQCHIHTHNRTLSQSLARQQMVASGEKWKKQQHIEQFLLSFCIHSVVVVANTTKYVYMNIYLSMLPHYNSTITAEGLTGIPFHFFLLHNEGQFFIRSLGVTCHSNICYLHGFCMRRVRFPIRLTIRERNDNIASSSKQDQK